MPKKGYAPEQIIEKLREAEVICVTSSGGSSSEAMVTLLLALSP